MTSAARANALAYATTTFGTAAMSAIFNLYYVELFLGVYGVTPGWFHAAQAVYLVWNAVNDPLFGWLQDRAGGARLAGRRQRAIRQAGRRALLAAFPRSASRRRC